MVFFIPIVLVDCVHALAGVGVYCSPISIKIIYGPVSGCKREAGSKGGKEVVVTESFGFGGNVDVRSGDGTDEGGVEDGCYEDREGRIVKCY